MKLLKGQGISFALKYTPNFLAQAYMIRSLPQCFSSLLSFSVNHVFFQEYTRLLPILFLEHHSFCSFSEGILCILLYKTEQHKKVCVTIKCHTAKPNSSPHLCLPIAELFQHSTLLPFFSLIKISQTFQSWVKSFLICILLLGHVILTCSTGLYSATYIRY